MSLSTWQEEVLLGMLLGDAHLEKNGRYVRLKVDHGPKQKVYAWWKYEVFRDLATQKPRLIVVRDKRTGRTYEHWRFATYSIPELETYHQLFYVHGRKVVPGNVKEWLSSPLTLAVWYMDDGARRTDCGALRLHTSAYSLEEHKILRKTLMENFNVTVSIHRVKGEQYVLYIPAEEAPGFCNLVKSFILPVFRYKLL